MLQRLNPLVPGYFRAPTDKSVGSEKVTKIGTDAFRRRSTISFKTDGFTRRSNKKKSVSIFETPSFLLYWID